MSKVAVVQMTSSHNVSGNLHDARVQLECAAREGVVLAALPENFALMGLHEQDKLHVAEELGDGPIQSWLSRCARELNLSIIGGTIPIKKSSTGACANGERVAAACLVYDPAGNCVARYDKIHLFDVNIPERNEIYRESATIAAGAQSVVVDSAVGRIGLGVCYDMRFPELFRHLVALGAELLSLPSAFTVPTGQAHWDVLLRARAIENLCYVLAPAQSGKHANGRETYGNAMIVSPWGDVLVRAGDGPGIAIAEIDLQSQAALRARFPALSHRRLQS
jgi:predicted amidohydrolase